MGKGKEREQSGKEMEGRMMEKREGA